MMTREQRNALRRLEAEATLGPWVVTGERIDSLAEDHPTVAWLMELNRPTHDAAFIAAARTAVPALLDEGERLRGTLGEDRKDGDGVIAALWWALDIIDLYERRLTAVDGQSPGHREDYERGTQKARAALAKARALAQESRHDEAGR